MAGKIQDVVAKRRAYNAYQIARLYLEGNSTATIADKLHLTFTFVKKSIETLEKNWQKKAAKTISIAKERELERLDHLTTVAWDAYWRTVGKKQRVITTLDKEGQPKPSRIEEWEDAGDPRFLAEIRALRESYRRLLGLDSPILLADATPLLTREDMYQRANEIVGRYVAGQLAVVEGESREVDEGESNKELGGTGHDINGNGNGSPNINGSFITHKNGNGQNGNGHH